VRLLKPSEAFEAGKMGIEIVAPVEIILLMLGWRKDDQLSSSLSSILSTSDLLKTMTSPAPVMDAIACLNGTRSVVRVGTGMAEAVRVTRSTISCKFGPSGHIMFCRLPIDLKRGKERETLAWLASGLPISQRAQVVRGHMEVGGLQGEIWRA
jgi:hypothetical protein